MELKKERHWLIFKRQIPENEWEAKYLAQQDKTYTWATAVSDITMVCFITVPFEITFAMIRSPIR